MRWLRTAIRQLVQSMTGASPVRRIQPRAMLVAESLTVEKVRSASVRRL
jgi:hypothetical protein